MENFAKELHISPQKAVAKNLLLICDKKRTFCFKLTIKYFFKLSIPIFIAKITFNTWQFFYKIIKNFKCFFAKKIFFRMNTNIYTI